MVHLGAGAGLNQPLVAGLANPGQAHLAGGFGHAIPGGFGQAGAGGWGNRNQAGYPQSRYFIGHFNLETAVCTKLADIDFQVSYLFSYKDLIVCLDQATNRLRILDKSGAQVTNRVFETTAAPQNAQISLMPVAISKCYLVFLTVGGELVRINLDSEFVSELLYIGSKVRTFSLNGSEIYAIDENGNIIVADLDRLIVKQKKKIELPKGLKDSGMINEKTPLQYYGSYIADGAFIAFARIIKATTQVQILLTFQIGSFAAVSHSTIGIEGANSRFELCLEYLLHNMKHLILISNQGFNSAYLVCIERKTPVLRRVVKLTSEGSRGVGDRLSCCLAPDNKIVIGYSSKDKVISLEFK